MGWVEKPREKWDVHDLADLVVRGTHDMGCGCGGCRNDAENITEEPRSAMEEAFIRKALRHPKGFRLGKVIWYRDEEGHWVEKDC